MHPIYTIMVIFQYFECWHVCELHTNQNVITYIAFMWVLSDAFYVKPHNTQNFVTYIKFLQFFTSRYDLYQLGGDPQKKLSMDFRGLTCLEAI